VFVVLSFQPARSLAYTRFGSVNEVFISAGGRIAVKHQPVWQNGAEVSFQQYYGGEKITQPALTSLE